MVCGLDVDWGNSYSNICLWQTKYKLKEVIIEPIVQDRDGIAWQLLASIEEEADLRLVLFS